MSCYYYYFVLKTSQKSLSTAYYFNFSSFQVESMSLMPSPAPLSGDKVMRAVHDFILCLQANWHGSVTFMD